jgi:hypothetical protein
VGRRCKAKDVVAVLEELASLYPAPAFIHSVRLRALIHLSSSTGLVRGQRHHQPRPTLSQGSRGITALPTRSTASSGMSSSIPSCSAP